MPLVFGIPITNADRTVIEVHQLLHVCAKQQMKCWIFLRLFREKLEKKRLR